MDLHATKGIDFFETLESLGPRPWFVDDLDAITQRLTRGQIDYRKAFVFVDNAGGDVVLGIIPLARYLADNGVRVVLAANEAEKAANITLVNYSPSGRFGRLLIAGTESDVKVGRDAAIQAVNSLTGRSK